MSGDRRTVRFIMGGTANIFKGRMNNNLFQLEWRGLIDSALGYVVLLLLQRAVGLMRILSLPHIWKPV